MNRRAFLGLALAGCGSEPPETPPERGRGIYRVEQVDGIWWLVTPEGGLQISLGVNHVQPLLMLGPHNRRDSLLRYGADFVLPGSTRTDVVINNAGFELASDLNPHGEGTRQWAKRMLGDLTYWKFNALGYHTTLPRHHFRDELAYVQAIAAVRLERYTQRAGLDMQYLDPFAEATRTHLLESMGTLCGDCASDRNLIGWAFNDVPDWQVPEPPSLHPWVRAVASMAPSSSGKRHWVEFLERRHPDLASACRAHGVEADRWLDLLAVSDWPEGTTKAAHADGEAFLERIAGEWYKMQYWVVKSCDPDHLILGDKLSGRDIPAYLLPILERFVDVVYIQWYGRMDDQRERLIEIHTKTGKPILLGDSGFSVVAEHQTHAKGIHVETQQQVGEEYYRYLRAAMELPFVIGWHYCGYVEGHSAIEAHFPSRQSGLVDPWGIVHGDATARILEANQMAERWHADAKLLP